MGPRTHAYRVELGFVGAFAMATVFLVVQLLVGCHWDVCLGFTLALFFGWCACVAAGTWRSLLGLLTIAFYIKTVLFGCIFKTLLFQPMDVGLDVPVETSIVFALGFAAVWLAVLLQHALPRPALPLARSPANGHSWFVLLFLFFVVGGVAWYLGFRSRIEIVTNDISLGENFQLEGTAGRLYQIADQLAMFFPFAPAVAIFYIASKGSKKLITHPLVLISLLVSALPGLLEGRKSPLMIPLAAAGLSLLLLRGFRYKPFWVWSAISLILLMGFVFPFVQYSRYAVQQGSLDQRLSTIGEVAKMFSNSEDYKEMYSNGVGVDLTKPSYLPRKAVSLERFIRYVDASRLISATVAADAYTGFYTLDWGLRQIPPRSISPNKPLGLINNWLSHYAGDVGPDDLRTNFAYGFMASFYNAYGYAGVFFGTFLLYGVMLYWMRLFIESRPGPTIWVVVMFFLFENSLAEDSAGAMMSRVWLPVTILFLSFGMILLSKLIPGALRLLGINGHRRIGYQKELPRLGNHAPTMNLQSSISLNRIP